MCGVDKTGNKGKCTSGLCAVAPLETGKPYETVEEGDVWHPNWNGKIDDEVNTVFIKADADCIWENEEVSDYNFQVLVEYVLIFYVVDP